jgi:hypothetical protein
MHEPNGIVHHVIGFSEEAVPETLCGGPPPRPSPARGEGESNGTHR